MHINILQQARETIALEAASISRLSELLTDDFIHAIEAIVGCKGKLVITGMGKSGHIAKKIAATMASTGTPSFSLHPGEAFHGDLGMISPNDIVLAISNSGETDEVLKIVPFLKENGNILIAMSGNPHSSLATHADYHINTSVQQEACPLDLAPTTSTTAQMVMGDAMAVALMKVRGFKMEDFARFHPGGNLGRRLLLRIRDVMRSESLPVVEETTDMTSLISTLSKGRLGMVIVQRDQELLGVVTDGDVRRAMESKCDEFFTLHVSDIYSRSPKTISEAAKLVEAEQLMTTNKINTLLVVDDKQHLSGVVQIYDLKI